MATEKAPRGWGRGRSIVLTSVFAAALIAALATVSPAIAAEKGSDRKPEKSSASVSASVAQAEKHEDKTVSKSNNGASGNEASHGNGNPHPKKAAGTAIEENKQDRGPNKPVGDKYDGPCTRHVNTADKGPGHDWHQGEGKGHSATKTVEPPCDDDTDDNPPDDGDNPPNDDGSPPDDDTGPPKPDQTPGDEPGGTPGNQPLDGTVPDEQPYGPYRATPVVNTTSTTSTKSPEYLPYTGGESRLLLAVAACTALAGTKLRFYGRTRSYNCRRIAR